MLSLASINVGAQTQVAEEVLHLKPSSATVRVWINRVEQQARVILSYNPALIHMDHKVTVSHQGPITISRLLALVLDGYSYRLVPMPGRKLLIQIKGTPTTALSRDDNSLSAVETVPQAGLRGIVSEAGSGEKLLGATVTLTDYTGRRHYAVTGPDGSFYISAPQGPCQLNIHYMGYANWQQTIRLRGDMHRAVALSPIAFAIKTVNVERRKSMEELDEVAPSNMVAFSHADLYSQIRILPGVSTSAANLDFHAAGGSSDENLFLLDGFPVYNPGHINSMLSPFNGDVLKSVSFYNGFIPTQYEGRLSSVTDSRLRDGNKETFSNTLSLDMPAASVVSEGPIIKNKLSYLIGGRHSWLDFFDRFVSEDNRMNHSFYDTNVKLSLQLDSVTALSFSAYNSTDDYRLGEQQQSTSTLHWNNQLYALHFGTYVTPSISNQTSVAYARHSTRANPQDFGFDNLKELHNRIKTIYVNTQFTYTPGNLYTLRWGIKGTMEKYELTAFGIDMKSQWEPINQLSLFYDNRLRITSSFFAQVGVNYLRYIPRHYKGYSSIQPRLSLKYALDDNNMLYANIARTEQFFHHVRMIALATPFDFVMPSIKGFKPSTATHLEIGWKHFTRQGLLELSAYYKQRRNLLALRPDFYLENSDWSRWIMEGNGDSRGVGIYYYDQWKHWKWQLSYTFSKSREWFSLLADRGKLPSLYDVPHVLNGALSYQLGQSSLFTVGGNLHSGLIVMDDVDDYSDSHDSYATFRKQRDPMRFRVDASYSFQKDFKKSRLLLRFGLYNIIGNPSEDEMLHYFSIQIKDRLMPFGTISFKF
ncbi:TonB-dependent receptor [Prevotella sp. A2931]|uniref:TonB-dependent receptor n=2 Tax=Prevotellaceae TaxID=171552 RepID=A0ABS3M6H0_9BACT|nr:TonB-dependent receptor [Prevotella illustrans]PTL26809.1 TonB-dependent receptor [Prevotella sp. oral taxon 820]